eukprot:m.27089 g.27089  ORF g.27089 m.27089 type:complete len:50 (+) comp29765_c0_seq2:150-299(+)
MDDPVVKRSCAEKSNLISPAIREVYSILKCRQENRLLTLHLLPSCFNSW